LGDSEMGDSEMGGSEMGMPTWDAGIKLR